MFSITKKQAKRWMILLGLASAIAIAGAIILLVSIDGGNVLTAR